MVTAESSFRAALSVGDRGGVVGCCAAILRWGGVWARNGGYLREHANVVEAELRHLSAVLTSDRTPSANRVPPRLAFAVGVPREGRNALTPKSRDPSTDRFKFPRLRRNSCFHCEHTMRASWFLKATLDDHPHPFSGGEDGFHELAAALFMVGYDLSESAAA
jgi:hypothetical protein